MMQFKLVTNSIHYLNYSYWKLAGIYHFYGSIIVAAGGKSVAITRQQTIYLCGGQQLTVKYLHKKH